jgi:hypothetical protein
MKTITTFFLGVLALAPSIKAAPCPDTGVYMWPDAFAAAITETNCGQTVVLTNTATIALPPQLGSAQFNNQTILPIQPGTFHVAVYNANINLVTVTLLGAGVTWYFPPAGFVVDGALIVPAHTKVEFWPVGFGGWLPIISSAPASPNQVIYAAPCCSAGKLATGAP